MPNARPDSIVRSEQTPPFPEEVRAQLGRVIASPEFSVRERTRKFLRYVIEEALAGRAERIKAYAIAVEVFGRDQTFDAQNDPVVRIEAGRLRRALERYYLVAGGDNPVLVDIPKGGYVPAFTKRAVAAAGVASDNPAPYVLAARRAAQ
jgi:adenylate cyclase